MPNFKKHKFIAKNDAGHKEVFEEMVKVNAAGYFYCNVPDFLLPLVKVEKKKVFAETFEAILGIVQEALEKYINPTITEERVLCYNIASHVSFAEMPNGDITPNAVPEGATWAKRDEKYGDHDSSHPAKGGYSLTVGAKAYIKTTTSYGEHHSTQYDLYYGKGDHLDVECPASLLNSWCSFTLPKDAEEMPYTDEAAMFFYNLMLAVAELSRRIQDLTHDKKILLDTITCDSMKLLE